MKYLTLFGFIYSTLLVGVRPEEENWSADEQKCVEELKLNKIAIQALNEKDITPEDNVDFNNFLACYWKKKGTQKKNGEINWDKMDDLMAAEFENEFKENSEMTTVVIGEMVTNALNECHNKNIRGNTHGQTVVKVQNCIMKKMLTAAENYSG